MTEELGGVKLSGVTEKIRRAAGDATERKGGKSSGSSSPTGKWRLDERRRRAARAGLILTLVAARQSPANTPI